MSKNKDTAPLRCAACGRFIGYNDVNVVSEFTPDSHFTAEQTDFYHVKCLESK
jgi:hypothetical protein